FSINGTEQNTVKSYKYQEATSLTTQITASRFNPKYSFDSFIVSSCNRLAHAGALAVAENPGHSYNPLFMCGGAGLGKTHLLHAIGHMASANNIKVLYVSGEQFTNEFIRSIRNRETEEFHNKYRSVDMLLIDDIHFISGKEQTEECFFHTFNTLHDSNRQITITSDRPPSAMPHLEERLRSRFEWGLITDIQPPDFETRLAILQSKANEAGVNITLDVLEFIANQIKHNVRELEGSLNRIIAYSQLLRTLITPELAAQALEDISAKTSRNNTPNFTLVTEAVANNFNLSTVELKGRKRDKKTALARQVAMYLLKQETDYSLVQIGKELGGRNPSTVRHAYEKITNGIETNPLLKRRLLDIQQQLHPSKKR
ncbi:MAG: chromosomal replication initiator protein DnaA, partial [Dehalococcoidales bacterium]|nr:chromosomal replication initiator protein DnaA [Dehalococcoidales bacterium]